MAIINEQLTEIVAARVGERTKERVRRIGEIYGLQPSDILRLALERGLKEIEDRGAIEPNQPERAPIHAMRCPNCDEIAQGTRSESHDPAVICPNCGYTDM